MKRAMSDGYKECACDVKGVVVKKKDVELLHLKLLYAVTTFTFWKNKVGDAARSEILLSVLIFTLIGCGGIGGFGFLGLLPLQPRFF